MLTGFSRRSLFPLAFYLIAAPVCVLAKDDPLTDDTVVIKSEGSHQLLLPNDWPVQQKDGRIAPAPIEEYLSMKFGQVRTKFTQTDARVEALEQRLERVEEEHRALLKGLQLLEERLAREEGRHGDETQSSEAAEGSPR